MKFVIKHEIRGRIRVHLNQKKMTCEQADTLQYYLQSQPGVIKATVYERTADTAIEYRGDRKALLRSLQTFSYQKTEVPAEVHSNSSRALNATYKEKLITHVLLKAGSKVFLPAPVRNAYVIFKSFQYIGQGLRSLFRRKLEVSVLDATAIGVSVLRGNLDTAGSVMFLLGVGEILEDWTHKKSVADMARSMSLNVGKVWVRTGDGQEVLVATDTVKPGSDVIVRMGNLIPFDGTVTEGEAMVNQASFTGESLPVKKNIGSTVYAGTVVEEGEIVFCAKKTQGSTRYEKIIQMIEDSEKLKSSSESKASHLADQLVPWTLGGTALVWLLTRNVTKALSVLMVDFSCALKMAIPVSVLSAIREAGHHQITVKGGKFLEDVAHADTIVFDKTGTLTEARPTVHSVIPFSEADPDELLRVAACLEEHFPHSMAKAVVNAAKEKNLEHEEMHSKVNYIVAHGISSHIGENKIVIGSAHFIFEDEGCRIPEGYQERYDSLPDEYSHLYMAVNGVLVAVICIEDPLRPEAPSVISALKKAGIRRVVMMTGDSERTAASVAARVGVDQYFSEVLPEDKARFVEQEKAAGRTVIMVGDGINDSPALSAADVGIAISDGAELAREIADITVAADDLEQLLTLKLLSNAQQERIHTDYRRIVGINSALILMGVFGIVQPTTSALFHNLSTLAITMKSMQNLLSGQAKTADPRAKELSDGACIAA